MSERKHPFEPIQPRQINCPNCDFTGTVDQVISHQTGDPSLPACPCRRVLKCPHCPYGFETVEQLEDHFNREHKGEKPRAYEPGRPVFKSQGFGEPDLYVCGHVDEAGECCQFKSTIQADVIEHMTKNHRPQPPRNFPRTTPDTDPSYPSFDPMAAEGITAYCEEMARQLCPDDPAKQAMIVEGLRSMMHGKSGPGSFDIQRMAQGAAGAMMPGISSPQRFYVMSTAAPIAGIGTPEGENAVKIDIYDFFALFQSTWRIEIHPFGPVILLHRNAGGVTRLDPPLSMGFLEFLRPYGFIH